MTMTSLASTLSKTLASAVLTAAALGGCGMMCRACGGRKCGAQATAATCGACSAKCGACKAKCGAKKKQ
jgi:hypothetical protein